MIGNFCFLTLPCFILGLSELVTEIKQDHSAKEINSLCSQSQEGKIDFKYFQDAQPLSKMLLHYFYLSNQYPSDLFQQIWKSQVKEVAKTKAILTISDVVSKLWEPVFEECCQLIDSIQSRSITLVDVNKHFRKLDSHYINDHLSFLFHAIETCFERKSDPLWIRHAVDRMQHYWSLCEQADAARTVLELKESLKLEGNFEVIEKIASTFAASMDKATLDDIDQRLVETKSFLEQFTMDKRKLETLKSFASCLNIVEWIRKESKGMMQYYKLVH